MRVILTLCCASALAALAACGRSDAETLADHERTKREACITTHAGDPPAGTDWQAICTCAAAGEMAETRNADDIDLMGRRYERAMQQCIASGAGTAAPSGGSTDTAR